MTDVAYNRRTSRFLLVATVLGLASLVLPWWNLIVFDNSHLYAYFGSYLWGITSTGFFRSSLSYESWSYTTLALVGAGFLGCLLGYRFLRTNREKTKRLIILSVFLTLAGCGLYPIGLSYAFQNLDPNLQWWLFFVESRPFEIGIYRLFYFNSAFQMVFAEFLSIGYFLALSSMGLLVVALQRLRKTSQVTP